MWHFKIEYVIVGYCVYNDTIRYRMMLEAAWLQVRQ